MHGGLHSPGTVAVSAAAPLALVGLTVAIGASGSPSLQGTVAIALCNLIIVLGLQVFIGNSGVYSFGQLGFAMAGGYLAALLTVPASFSAFQTPGLPALLSEAQLDPLAATLIAVAGSVLLALLVGLPLMRTSTLAIPISTFAFLIVAYNVLANWDAVTGGSGGLVAIPTSTSVTSAGLWAGMAVLAALAFKWSASGYRLQATREDEAAARSLGVRLMGERMVGFVLSAALCGLGGALAAQQSGVLTPNAFYFAATVTTLTMLVVGGVRSVLGATVGALAITVVVETLRGFEEGHRVFGLPSLGETPGLAAIGLGVILLAVMIGRPSGLTGGREAGELLRRRRESCSSSARGHGVRLTSIPREGAHLDRGTKRQELVADGVSLAFGGLQVLRDVSLVLRPGERLGLIGPNGAGKTTLVNVISGFQRADAGSVYLGGGNVSGHSPARLARAGLVRSFQAALPFEQLSCLESVAVGAMGTGAGRRRAVGEARAVLTRLGLLELSAERAGSLPAGSQRLLGIARALATRPRYLLLDEPAAGLNDQEGAELVEALRDVVADFDCGLLLIEHDINLVTELCTRVQVLDQGRTVALGSPEAVQRDPAVIESYLGSGYPAVAGA